MYCTKATKFNETNNSLQEIALFDTQASNPYTVWITWMFELDDRITMVLSTGGDDAYIKVSVVCRLKTFCMMRHMYSAEDKRCRWTELITNLPSLLYNYFMVSVFG